CAHERARPGSEDLTYAQGRKGRTRRRGCRGPAERDVPRQARQHGPRGARSRGRQDAPFPDPHPAGRPGPRRALALRPRSGADRLPPPLSELELIEALERLLAGAGGRVVRSIGDDASVVRADRYAVTSVDAMVDGIHFRSDQLRAEEIGHRALAAAASDLAAMGARPGEAYLVLGLPSGFGTEAALALVR